jgi:hypothetical protein
MHLKSKRGLGKRRKEHERAVADDSETIPAEPKHSLLLSSLRYWEVERDFIEERVAAVVR